MIDIGVRAGNVPVFAVIFVVLCVLALAVVGRLPRPLGDAIIVVLLLVRVGIAKVKRR